MNNPFNVNEGVVKVDKTVKGDYINRSTVRNTYEQAKSLETNAEVSFEGWGVTAKGSMA